MSRRPWGFGKWLTIVEETNVRQICNFRSALLQLVKRLTILHNPVTFAFGVLEEIDIILAARRRVRLWLEIAATSAKQDVNLRS